jgi:translation initiation factor 4B
VHSITLITFFVFFVEAIYKEKLLLPTAPRAARGSDIDESRIPNNAPYTAYIANLPYDIEVEDVSKFFHGLTVRLITS